MGRVSFDRKCLSVASSTFLLWDALCTVPEEWEYFWLPRKTSVSYLFFLCRYMAIFDVLSFNVASFADLSLLNCKIYNFVHQILLVLLQAIVCGLLLLRIFALYQGEKKVVALFVLVIAGVGGVTLWGLLTQPPNIPVSNCFTTSGVEPVASWIALFVFDCLTFALTVAKTWTARQQMHASKLMCLLLRDGAFYFIVMAVANLVNIFSFFFQRGIMRGSFSTFSNSIAVVLMTRLLMNLRRAIYRGEAQGFLLGTSSTRTTLQFVPVELSLHCEVKPMEDTELGALEDIDAPIEQFEPPRP